MQGWLYKTGSILSMNMSKLNESIYVLLAQKRINNFSISELKNAYMVEFTDYKTEIEARTFIYRQVYKLVNDGYLIKNGTKYTRNIRYHHSEKFKNIFLMGKCKENREDTNEVDFKFVLESKLVEYKELLVVSTAETEEYERCVNQYPQLLNTLKLKLNLAKHKRSQFIGKITAIENIINSN